jgi:hypothetical protein
MSSGDDSRWLILALVLFAAFFLNRESGLREQLNTCKIEHQGFKDGVIYGRGR